MPLPELRSPRLISVQRQLEAGHSAILDAFWHDIAALGTPLIEPILSDDDHALVTFLYRGDPATESVVVMSPITEPTSRTMFLQPMTRLAGSDIWYASGSARTDLRATYRLSTDAAFRAFEAVALDPVALQAAMPTFRPDPLNRQPFPADDPLWSTVILPAAPPQPWIVVQPDVPTGTLCHQRLRSRILDDERDIWVYLPPHYAPDAEPCHLLVLFDGQAYREWIPTPTILDNLTAAGQLPPTVAALVDHPNAETRVRELSCSPSFCDFVVHELVPWVTQTYRVSADPQRHIVGGSSLGGLTAAYLGLRHPHVFAQVLCQSGSFWWSPADDREAEWLTRQFVASPPVPIHIYLDAGLHELWTRSADRPNLLIANRHLRDVLRARGYDVHYGEFNGWHDYISWRGTLADGLVALTRSGGAAATD